MFAWKYRVHAILILSVLAIIFIPQISNKPDKNKIEAATAAVQEFLSLVDAGRYEDSWSLTDSYLQKQIPLGDWDVKLKDLRAKVGPITERTLADASITAPADELPEQEVMLLEYDSQFEKQSMIEIVTVVQGLDNRWRVVGYFMQ